MTPAAWESAHPLVFAPELLDPLLDEDGRCLGEHATRVDASEQAACPYAGSRAYAGRPMNTAALRQMGMRWHEGLAVLSAAHALDETAPPLVAVEACLVLPLWFARAPCVPGPVAVAYKAAKGLRPVLRELWLERALTDCASVTPESVLECAESSGALVGTVEVCAAPPALIVEVAQTLQVGGPTPWPLAVDRGVWRRLAWARPRFELTRTLVWASRWWHRVSVDRSRAPAAHSLPIMGPSIDDRWCALAPEARALAASRLAPFVSDLAVSAALSGDLEGAHGELLAAAQAVEDATREVLGMAPRVLPADSASALLSGRAHSRS